MNAGLAPEVMDAVMQRGRGRRCVSHCRIWRVALWKGEWTGKKWVRVIVARLKMIAAFHGWMLINCPAGKFAFGFIGGENED